MVATPSLIVFPTVDFPDSVQIGRHVEWMDERWVVTGRETKHYGSKLVGVVHLMSLYEPDRMVRVDLGSLGCNFDQDTLFAKA